jgi:leucyl/phenylalanyl-tRNA--protein transferase
MIPATTLLRAYRAGFFPMAVKGRIHWFSPERRGIVPLDRFHMPRRLRRTVCGGRFEVSVNRAFGEVIAACAAGRTPRDTWIDDTIIDSYTALYRQGSAHSVETWRDGVLVGGLYGVSIRGAFFGESMFHRFTDASKVALCALVERLRERGYVLLDVQWVTPHLARLGAVGVPRAHYLTLLDRAMQEDCSFA